MYEKEIAKQLHNEYEKYAKEVGWKTQESTQVPFDNLPKENKEVMLKMGKFVSSLITKAYNEGYNEARGITAYPEAVDNTAHLQKETNK